MSDEKLIHPVTGEVLSPATPAATMVIFRNNPEGGPPLILMVERVKSMVFAGGAVVFPGGKVDDHDRAFAGILDHGVSNPADCAEARAALHDGASLKEICDDYGWTPRLDQLVPWARWRPPSMETRVFDTRFYLLDAGDTHLPAVVDNTENRMLFWDSAQGVLDRLARKEVKAIFPTVRNLERLALFQSFADTAAHAAEYPSELMLTYVEERDGVTHICIPEGFGYPVTAEAITSALRG